MNYASGPRYNIGIDIGGTNTDGVLYDPIGKRVISYAKLPTRHSSYAEATESLLGLILGGLGGRLNEVVSLNISTTVSTNALLEGKGDPSNLILIGFEKYPHIVSDILGTISPPSILKVRGGHTGWGNEREPLDVAAVENFVKGRQGELFTVSSIYSPRNPGHEAAVKKILLANGTGHVTCSHEFSYSRLNSVKRTVTAYLNTSLVPLAGRLIDDMGSVAKKYGLSCPVMFLRSDSTLVPSDWCKMVPIEMIYSGPAASLRGAYHMAGEENLKSFLVADIGGTSTDIGRMCGGRAVFSGEGAKIGNYRTMIPSLDIMSIALGGDSRAEIRGMDDVVIGPERSVPLCRIAEEKDISEAEVIRDIFEGPDEVKVIHASSAEDGSDAASSNITCCSASLRRWMAEGYSYTPTDAFNAMGLSAVGDPEISKAASRLTGKIAGIDSLDLASAVAGKAHLMLESSISEYASKSCGLPRVYVGTPAKVFAELGIKSGFEIIVPENCGVGGAVGAATSSMELACRVFIMHSFSDESFTAFLPESTISSDDFPRLMEDAENAVTMYLMKLSGKMGFSDVKIVMDKEFSYAGDEKKISALLSLSIDCRVIVKDAQ